MSDDTLSYATIRELGRMIRSGETTPTRLAEYFIGRLETIGSRLNAVVTITGERAMREARQAEAELAAGYDRGPLHGIPYGLKDLVAASGYPTTWGVEPLREQRFDDDATVVQRFRNAGAVLVAKLAMVELAGGMYYIQPNAALTGPGINPWNQSAWTGGSSSGSGSAVGAGLVPFAIGSETGGSILNPSSYCGVSGLRPTYGRISRHGAMALCWTFDKLGPMCRTADDCGLVLDAIAGYDPDDPTTLRQTYRYTPERERTSSFRLGVIQNGVDRTQPEVRANFERACAELANVATLDDVTLPDLPYGDVYAVIMAAEGASAFEDLIERGVVQGLTAPEDRLGGYAGAVVPAVDYLRAMRVRRQINQAADQLLARYDAVLFPATAVVASPLDTDTPTYMRPYGRRTELTALGNVAGLPGLSVPNGFGERGLPTGMQIVGRAGTDNAVLAVGAAYQARTDWHQRHPEL